MILADGQYKEPMMDKKDHLDGQLTIEQVSFFLNVPNFEAINCCMSDLLCDNPNQDSFIR